MTLYFLPSNPLRRSFWTKAMVSRWVRTWSSLRPDSICHGMSKPTSTNAVPWAAVWSITSRGIFPAVCAIAAVPGRYNRAIKQLVLNQLFFRKSMFDHSSQIGGTAELRGEKQSRPCPENILNLFLARCPGSTIWVLVSNPGRSTYYTLITPAQDMRPAPLLGMVHSLTCIGTLLYFNPCRWFY